MNEIIGKIFIVQLFFVESGNPARKPLAEWTLRMSYDFTRDLSRRRRIYELGDKSGSADISNMEVSVTTDTCMYIRLLWRGDGDSEQVPIFHGVLPRVLDVGMHH